ncbi:MAG: antibiotic biosynthesis monooxygenase [Lachnospiraceae bacterium]|nr:antibiotic biosynthesis monooxygenase [Lachnospiraceae bacterium]
MTQFFGVYQVKEGKRAEYIEELKKAGLEAAFRKQPGNLYYYIGASVTDENQLIAIDLWKDKAAFDGHCTSPEVVGKWNELYAKYVEKDIESNVYEI